MRKSPFLFLILLFSFSISAQQLDELNLESLLPQEILADEPGITIGVLTADDQLLFQRGAANIELGLPIQESTIFPIASISKQFTAACIGLLAKEGKLSIEDDIRKYLPELPDYGEVIQIQHLFHHTSGLRNYNVLLDLQGFDYDNVGYRNEDIEQLILQQQGINHKPGEKMLYSNSNYVLMALIVERISGKDFETFATESLFRPLGMNNSYYKQSLEESPEIMALEYFVKGDSFAPYYSLDICNGAGGVRSTVSDLLKWSELFFDPDHPDAWLAQFLTQQANLNDGELLTYARGVFVSDHNGHEIVHHGGLNWGLRTKWVVVPEENIAVVALCNSRRMDPQEIAFKIIDQLLPERPQVVEPEMEKESFQDLGISPDFLGEYQELNSDLRMKIFQQSDTLMALSSFGRHPVPLETCGPHEYCRQDDATVKHIFFPKSEKEWDMIVSFSGANFYFEKVELVDPELVQPKDFAGMYYSDELGVSYILKAQDGQLHLKVPNQDFIPLSPSREDEFGSGRRCRYTFHRNKEGLVVSFEAASEGTVKEILFERLMEE